MALNKDQSLGVNLNRLKDHQSLVRQTDPSLGLVKRLSQQSLDVAHLLEEDVVDGIMIEKAMIKHPEGRGVLQVEVIGASEIKGDKVYGWVSTSPYVKMFYGGMKMKSTADRCGGSNPIWNQRFTFNIHHESQVPPRLHILIFDLCFLNKDTQIGCVSIEDIADYLRRRENMCTPYIWIPIFHFNQKNNNGPQQRGTILVRFFFEEKDDHYFGDGRFQIDHVAKFEGNMSIDITQSGEIAKYQTLYNILATQNKGTLIKLLDI